MKDAIITISREYGSRGRTIGKRLAEKLNIPFYDNEIITLSAKESGFSEAIFNNSDEAPVSSLLYSLSMFGAAATTGELPLNDKVYIIQSGIIKNAASKGSCVIVGRCADYILKETPDLIKIFIYADVKDKIEWAIEQNGIGPDKAKDLIVKKDKKRAAYYNYYTNEKWGSAKNYDICFNSSGMSVDDAADFIDLYIKSKAK